MDDVLSHPVAGPSSEGFVIENLLAAAPEGTDAFFGRTREGAEIDLLLRLPDQGLWAIEVKRSSAPRLRNGFRLAVVDVRPAKQFAVHSGEGEFPLAQATTAVLLTRLISRLLRMR